MTAFSPAIDSASESPRPDDALRHPFTPGLLAWAVADRSAQNFESAWTIVSLWKCFFDVTDGLKVYPKYIPEGDPIVNKLYVTCVKGEKTHLRHDWAPRLHRKTLCYSKQVEMLERSIRLLIHDLKWEELPLPSREIPNPLAFVH